METTVGQWVTKFPITGARAAVPGVVFGGFVIRKIGFSQLAFAKGGLGLEHGTEIQLE